MIFVENIITNSWIITCELLHLICIHNNYYFKINFYYCIIVYINMSHVPNTNVDINATTKIIEHTYIVIKLICNNKTLKINKQYFLI